jgi:hypothetical protein
MVKVVDFHVVHFKTLPLPEHATLPPKEAILIYALGEDGIIYEFSTATWMPLAIDDDCMREPPWKDLSKNRLQ